MYKTPGLTLLFAQRLVDQFDKRLILVQYNSTKVISAGADSLVRAMI